MKKYTTSTWNDILSFSINNCATDIHITGGQPPFGRINGTLSILPFAIPTSDDLFDVLKSIASESQLNHLKSTNELDFACTLHNRRLRINAYQQRGSLSFAIRIIPKTIPSLEDLNCPSAFYKLTQINSGLILITGRTGAGKTTTMASLLSSISQNKPQHIISLEDPIEYILEDKKSFISQREYGIDFFSFPLALKSALRQVPDVIGIGEMRDADTIRTALDAASTGHLVIASMHTNSAPETIMRIESFFPAEQQIQIRSQLSLILKASIAQQLLPKKDNGRIAAFEIMIATPAIKNLIRSGKIQQLKSNILSGKEDGMVTMEKYIESLLHRNIISLETAKQYCEELSNGIFQI